MWRLKYYLLMEICWVLPNCLSGLLSYLHGNNKDISDNACDDVVISTKLNNGCVSLLDPTEGNNNIRNMGR